MPGGAAFAVAQAWAILLHAVSVHSTMLAIVNARDVPDDVWGRRAQSVGVQFVQVDVQQQAVRRRQDLALRL